MISLNGKWKTGLDRNYTDESNDASNITTLAEVIESISNF